MGKTCGPKQDLIEYAYELKRLARKAYPEWDIPERMLIDLFIKGLPDEETMKLVSIADTKTLDEAIKVATKCDVFN